MLGDGESVRGYWEKHRKQGWDCYADLCLLGPWRQPGYSEGETPFHREISLTNVNVLLQWVTSTWFSGFTQVCYVKLTTLKYLLPHRSIFWGGIVNNNKTKKIKSRTFIAHVNLNMELSKVGTHTCTARSGALNHDPAVIWKADLSLHVSQQISKGNWSRKRLSMTDLCMEWKHCVIGSISILCGQKRVL